MTSVGKLINGGGAMPVTSPPDRESLDRRIKAADSAGCSFLDRARARGNAPPLGTSVPPLISKSKSTKGHQEPWPSSAAPKASHQPYQPDAKMQSATRTPPTGTPKSQKKISSLPPITSKMVPRRSTPQPHPPLAVSHSHRRAEHSSLSLDQRTMKSLWTKLFTPSKLFRPAIAWSL